jgi:hypothetical protein
VGKNIPTVAGVSQGEVNTSAYVFNAMLPHVASDGLFIITQNKLLEMVYFTCF